MKTIRLMIVLFAVILTTTVNAQKTEKVLYYPKLPDVEISVAKINLERVLKSMYCYKNRKWMGKPEEVAVFDDRFELTFKEPKNTLITFYFSDLSKYTLNVVNVYRPDGNESCELRLGDLMFNVYKGDNGFELPDYLYFFQHPPNEKLYSSQLVLFEPVAAQYRALQVKPPVSEGQRKFIVQANLLNQQKMYVKAMELYIKAIEVDQTAYPAAWSNLALLSAQVHKFNTAIFYMKKYLMLEPEASDARSCQDKIYEWEIMMLE